MKHLVRGLFCLVLAGLVLPLFAAGRNQREDEPIILTVWDFKYGEAVTGRAFREIDELFMRENPGITINHVAQP
jgi:ABC-type glycerol-3-phosphate transport system substrate-binding protein